MKEFLKAKKKVEEAEEYRGTWGARIFAKDQTVNC